MTYAAYINCRIRSREIVYYSVRFKLYVIFLTTHFIKKKLCKIALLFCDDLLYQYKFFENDLNLTILAQLFLNKMSGQKSQTTYNL